MRTLIVHVPVLGATREHVDQTLGLVTGGNFTHYWDESGIIGRYYDDVLELDGIYAWDVWFIYKPGVTWTATLPPIPDFTMHQLGRRLEDLGFLFLDSKVFAARTNEILNSIAPPSDDLVVELSAFEFEGSIPTIAQPASVAIGQHIMGRGGYRNIKQIQRIEQVGTVTVNGVTSAFIIEQNREGYYRRVVKTRDGESIAERDSDRSVSFSGPANGFGLGVKTETALLNQYDIDGPIVDWKRKNHDFSTRVDMEKKNSVLAWVLDERLSEGQKLRFLIDTHGGHLVQETHLSEAGEPELIIEYGGHHESERNKLPVDFQLDDGQILEKFVVPKDVTFRDGTGSLLAKLHFTEITITTAH